MRECLDYVFVLNERQYFGQRLKTARLNDFFMAHNLHEVQLRVKKCDVFQLLLGVRISF